MPPEEKAWRDTAIGKQLLAWLEQNPAPSIGVYWPYMGEPDLTPIYPELTAQGIVLALPVVMQRNAPLAFYRWQPGEKLIKDAHGVMAPAMRRSTLAPDLLLLPCVGFNAANYRIGYGGGYYDRTLAFAPTVQTAGIAYLMSKVTFKADTHDMPLGCILTEFGACREDNVASLQQRL